MSSKHLRRLMKEKEEAEQAEKRKDSKDDGSTSDEELDGSHAAAPVNRFAFLEEEDQEEEEEKEEKQDVETQSVQQGNDKKKKKRTKKKKAQRQYLDDLDEINTECVDVDSLIDRLVKQNEAIRSLEDNDNMEIEDVNLQELFKPDPRLFDASAELKRAIGRFKDNTKNKTNIHRQDRVAGRIVKEKPSWPPIRNIGLSMIEDVALEKNGGSFKWFKFVHNSNYEKLEKLCYLSETTYDPNIVQEILQDNYYHLNSLLLLANVFQMQEDVTQSSDCIERGIFYCEQSFHALFHAQSWYHRMDYLTYENRAFFLLLHRHMLNTANKRCFETSLNVAKLIFSLDPSRDPLGLILVLDTLAISGKQYKWLKQVYEAAKTWKNLNLLPNFNYSLAMAHFCEAKTEKEFEKADELLISAVCAFPTVVTELLNELQVQADPLVETNPYFSVYAANKETAGLKLVMKIYVKRSAEHWKNPDHLTWLERITRKVVQDEKYQSILEESRATRSRIYPTGVPPGIARASVLLGINSSDTGVTDPIPPVNGKARYNRSEMAPMGSRPDSFFSGMLHSLYPDYNSQEHLNEVMARLGAQLQNIVPRDWIAALRRENPGGPGGHGAAPDEQQQQPPGE